MCTLNQPFLVAGFCTFLLQRFGDLLGLSLASDVKSIMFVGADLFLAFPLDFDATLVLGFLLDSPLLGEKDA